MGFFLSVLHAAWDFSLSCMLPRVAMHDQALGGQTDLPLPLIDCPARIEELPETLGRWWLRRIRKSSIKGEELSITAAGKRTERLLG